MTDVTYYFNSKSTTVWTDPEKMVDNILTNYATTVLDSDTEVLNGNSCPGTNLGTISKVEIRAYAYGDGDDRIDLTPVFSGGDGDEHQTTPANGTPGWGTYQDITSDTNHPSPWTWSAVQDLDCKVEYDKVAAAHTMYCAKVEVRVTYAEAAAWLSGFSYRKKGAVNSTTAGAQTNYQKKLLVGETSGATGEDVDCVEHCIDFPNDIRFTKEDGITEHNYFVQSLSGTSPNRLATFHINAASIPASGSVDLYIYYGKQSDVGESDGDNTFYFFDDFGDTRSQNVLSAGTTQISASALGTEKHNVNSFINRALWSYNGKQYVTYISNGGDVMVGKRTLPSGSWTVYDTGINVGTSDNHESVSLGIDSSGYIHISYGMHNDPLKYARSNSAEDPSTFTVKSMTGNDEAEVTYPQFFIANNILFFSYRDGTSAPSQMLNKYNTSTETWSSVFHPLVQGTSGNVAYVDSFIVDDDEYIHVSFMWRTSSSPIQHSNYSYAYSDNSGATWKKSDGTAYNMPITQTNAEKFASGMISGLLNQNHIDVDGNGHPHIAYWKFAGGYTNYFHTWHNGSSWITVQLTAYTNTPTSLFTGVAKGFGRPGILINRTTNKVYILTRRVAGAYIEVLSASSPYTSWAKKKLGNKKWGWQEFGGIDYDKWHSEDNLYLVASRVQGDNPVSIHILKSNLETTENATLGGDYMLKDKWDTLTGTPSIGSGLLHLNITEAIGSREEQRADLPFAYGVRVKYIVDDDVRALMVSMSNQNWRLYPVWDDHLHDPDILYPRIRSNGVYYAGTNVATAADTWYITEGGATTVKQYLWIDGVQKNSRTDDWSTPSDFRMQLQAAYDGEGYYDWCFVRNFANPEPTWGSWGAEESGAMKRNYGYIFG